MKRILFPLCLVFALATLAGSDAKNRQLEVHWIDVEGGAATLIVTPTGETVLMDCGWPGERDAARIVSAVKAAGAQRIDHFLTSHWHTDHFGGLARLAEAIPIQRYYDHGFPELPKSDIIPALVEAYRKATGGKTTILKPGDEVMLKQLAGAPKLTLRIVAAHGVVLGEPANAPQTRACTRSHDSKPDDPSDNARSLAFVLQFGGFEFFDAGDLTWNVEHKLVCPTNLIGTVDVYQVTHHGADSSNHPAVLQALQPRVAVMNNGARKGGAAVSVQTLKATRSVEAVFAMHRNVTTGPTDNADPSHTANDEEQCRGEGIRLAVAADAKSYTVTVPAKGTTKTFTTR